MRSKTMRNLTTFLLGLAIVVAGVSAGSAQDAKTPSKSPPAQAAPAKTAETAKLRAEVHRTVAALIEAQSAEKPDAAKVKELTAKVQELRSQILADGPPWQGRALRPGAPDGAACGAALGWEWVPVGVAAVGAAPGWAGAVVLGPAEVPAGAPGVATDPAGVPVWDSAPAWDAAWAGGPASSMRTERRLRQL